MAVFTGNGYRDVVNPHARVGEFSELPIIDLEPSYGDNREARIGVAQQVRDACTRVGFFYIKNTTMPEKVRGAAFQAGEAFFKLPLEVKMRSHVNKNPAFFGYTGMFDENTDVTKKGDLHECFDINYQAATDYLKHSQEDIEKMMQSGEVWPTRWPEGIAEHEFRRPMEAYQREILRIGRHLVRLFALALNMPEDFFDDKLAVPSLIQRVLIYPPQEKVPQEDHLGIGAHTDYNTLTILAQDHHNGLQVLNRKGEWIEAPPIPGTFVVNISDLLARWTNDVFVSTVHRVINQNQTVRYSMPAFFGVNFRTVVEALPTCVSKETPAKYPPVIAGEYVLQRLRDTYPQREATWTESGSSEVESVPNIPAAAQVS
ncbi:Clavaminate synthase-like protein [Thozetella sp. PMI_491]|nr:Clavaminate synthase-like protein [Thozetella sp. PMI_491]